VIQDLARERGRERLRELAPQWLERLERVRQCPSSRRQPKRSLTRASNCLAAGARRRDLQGHALPGRDQDRLGRAHWRVVEHALQLLDVEHFFTAQ